MTYRLHLPEGTKCSEDAVLRRFIANLRSAVAAGDAGSVRASQKAKARLAEIVAEKRLLAARLMHRRLP